MVETPQVNARGLRGAPREEPSPAEDDFKAFLLQHLEEQKRALIKLIQTGEWEDE